MPRRSRRGDDSDSDSTSSGSSRSSRSSRGSRASRRSTQTSVSRAAIKDDNWAIKIMKVAAGAPTGPVAVKKVTYQVPYEYDEIEYVGGREEEITRIRYREYYRYYWEQVEFDDSISEIDSRRQRQSSRMSSSTKASKARRTKRFVEERPAFEPPHEESYYDEEEYDVPYGQQPYEPEYFQPPPMQQPRQNFDNPPPPPPPPAGGPGFINITGQKGVFRDGWD